MTKINKRTYLKVQRIVSEITDQNIISKRRQRGIVEGRGIYFTILRDIYGMSYQAIGQTLGMNHASVMHSIKNFKYWLITNKQLRDHTEEAYNVVKGITKIEDTRDNLADQLHESRLNEARLQKKLKDDVLGVQEAIEKYQERVIKVHTTSVLEKIILNKGMKTKFPEIVEQIKSELDRRYL